jgi:hypothetical protein
VRFHGADQLDHRHRPGAGHDRRRRPGRPDGTRGAARRQHRHRRRPRDQRRRDGSRRHRLDGTTGAVTPGTTGSPLPGNPGPGRSGPGVTATKVYIGVVQDESAGALNSAVGVGSITSGDDDANTRAVIKDINAHGGVGGRELVLVRASFDQTSTVPFDQQFAAICQQFTRDRPVFAVVDSAPASAVGYRQCLARAGVSIVSSGLPFATAATFASIPGWFELGTPSIDRLAAYLVPTLSQQRYFTPWNTVSAAPAAAGNVRVGILTYNDRDFSQTVDRILVPALKRLGYDAQVARISQLNAASDTGNQAAAVKAAQLSFAANGVTHVIPFETNGNLSTFFLPTARSQGYYPRYGGNTASAFEALLESGVVEQRQMNGAVGYGWIPSLDLRRQDNPVNGPYSNAANRSCMALMKANGITFDSGNAEGIAQNTCSVFSFLKAALDRTPSQITMATFVRAAEGLGSSFVKAGGLGVLLGPGRHDGANKAYFWHHVPDCGCFRYYGPRRTIP